MIRGASQSRFLIRSRINQVGIRQAQLLPRYNIPRRTFAYSQVIFKSNDKNNAHTRTYAPPPPPIPNVTQPTADLGQPIPSKSIPFQPPVPPPPPNADQTISSSGSSSESDSKKDSKLKQLMKKYGWSAFWVYMALSVVDFTICFICVRMLGQDKIAEQERKAREWLDDHNMRIPFFHAEAESEEKAESAKGSIWTEVILAYSVHKLLIFLRVPITAGITPPVVKYLRSWGWKIGPKS